MANRVASTGKSEICAGAMLDRVLLTDARHASYDLVEYLLTFSKIWSVGKA